MLQKDRSIALKLFSRGTRPLLVATDVAGRGLDLPDVSHVINYGMRMLTYADVC
jgi:superfamily II DNA/RNA helicase